jgi:transposase-like protein
MSQNGNPMKNPATEVTPKAKRRKFSAAYKLRILQEYEACEPGKKGALLRRKGLYSSNITDWKRERQAGLKTKKRGPKSNPQALEIARLERENDRLRKKLKQAELVIEVQKKVTQLLEQMNEESENS